MKRIREWWFPDHETELRDATTVLKAEGYQINQRRWSLEGVTQYRRALDIGAHVGLWSRDLVKIFGEVWAFEPHPEHRQCLEKNVTAENLRIFPWAVGEREGTCDLEIYPGRSGHTHRKQGTAVRLVSLDDLNIDAVDYIKIDVEGFEYEVLVGAEQLIRKHRPRMCIEQKQQHHQTDQDRYRARELLKSWGARELRHHGDDWVLAWD